MFKYAKEGDIKLLNIPGIGITCDKLGNTPLHYLALSGNSEVLKHGNISNFHNIDYDTALHFLARTGNIDIITHYSYCTTRNKRGRTPLHVLCEYISSENVLSILVDTNIDKIKDNDWNTPLHILGQRGMIDIINHKSHNIIKNKFDETPFQLL